MQIQIITLLLHLGAALLAGLLLNLTPCVLPAIPIKVRTMLREAGGELSHRTAAAFAFGGGVLLFFLGIASLTAFMHWSWGTLFQSPVVVTVLVVLLVLFAVITWLDVPIPVPAFAAQSRGHRYVEAFLSGLFSSLLAAPCAGPFLGGVLVYAVTQPTPIIFLLFASVGLGLALPYILLLLKPHWLRRLPRPGAWSETVRQSLAFVLLAAAVFFAQALVGMHFGRALWWGWLAAVAGWGLLQIRRGWASRSVAFVVLIGAAVLVKAMVPTTTVGTPDGVRWTAYSPSWLKAAQERHRPLLLEFTADWCINCKVLEKTVYQDPAVEQAIKQQRVLPLQVDLTRADPPGQALLLGFGGHALPFAVVIGPKGQVIARFTGLFSTTRLRREILDIGLPH